MDLNRIIHGFVIVFLAALLSGCVKDEVTVITPETDPVRFKPVPAYYVLPEVHILTTMRAAIKSKTEWVEAQFLFKDIACYHSPERMVSAKGRIKGRGNTTWNMPKKPWHIKLDEKISVFGDWPNKDWVLLANYSDKSLLRNMTAMELSRICGMDWTPTMISVEVYLNNEYQGVYSFSEHKEVAKHRVNITPAGPRDLEGDYYLEIESNLDEPTHFKTDKGTNVNFHNPEFPSQLQQTYVKKCFDTFEKAITVSNAPKATAWTNYFDLESLVDYFIVEEICRDPDGGIYKSTFISKEKGKPLRMCHVWDFDITLGNCNYTNGDFANPIGWHMPTQRWYKYLIKQPEFRSALIKKWKMVYPDLKKVPEYIDRQQGMIGEAADRNFQKWKILNKYVWPNKYLFPTYQEEVDFLKDFYSKRIEWMNRQIVSNNF